MTRTSASTSLALGCGSAEDSAARMWRGAGDLEVSEFLNDFSATRLYAGAPMFRMHCFAYQANASWARFGYGAI
jgi:hypothetical protein